MIPTRRDIPPWTALTVIALALIASIVSGREPPALQPHASTSGRTAEEKPTSPDVETLKLARSLESPGDPLVTRSDLLPTHALLVTTEIVPAPAEPAPSPARIATARPARAAPPLPFTYLAKLIDGDKTTVFVARGQDHYSAEPGLTIDDTYRVERVTDSSITFLHIPSRTRQALAVPSLAE